MKAWNICQDNPGSLGLIVRKEYTDLRDSTINDFEKYFRVKVNSRKEYEFPNGSKIMFRHGDMNDINVLKNINLTFFYIEQAEEYENAQIFHFLRDRLRRSGKVRCGFIIANANGQNWIFELFIKNSEKSVFEERTGQYKFTREAYLCCTANTFANAHNLPSDFIDDLRRMETEDPEHYRQYVLNDFNVVASPDILIPSEILQIAFDRKYYPDQYTRDPLTLGVDVSRFGDDSSIILARQGLQVFAPQKYQKTDLMTLVGHISQAIERLNPDAVFIDGNGVGGGVVDRLRQLNFTGIIGVDSGSRALEKDRYFNRRSEMWCKMAEWCRNGGALPQECPDLKTDLSSIKYGFDALNRRKLEPKDMMKKRLGRSPDYGDALALTFAFPVRKKGRFGAVGRQEFAKTEYDVIGNVDFII